jgi:hypothetical protein
MIDSAHRLALSPSLSPQARCLDFCDAPPNPALPLGQPASPSAGEAQPVRRHRFPEKRRIARLPEDSAVQTEAIP